MDPHAIRRSGRERALGLIGSLGTALAVSLVPAGTAAASPTLPGTDQDVDASCNVARGALRGPGLPAACAGRQAKALQHRAQR
jgi:hypothetical protein